MKHVFAVFPGSRSVSFVAGSTRFIGSGARRFAARVRFPDDRYKECCVNIRSVCSSAAAALGIGWSAWSSSAMAGTVFVHAAYVPVAAVCPPARAPRAAYAPSPAYVVQASVTAAATAATVATVAPPVKPLPYAAVPIPLPCGAAVPAAVPVRNIVYAQPVRAVPAVTVSAIAAPR
jgi:hypothetical protein